MKIGVLTIAFNEEPFIQGCFEQFADFPFHHEFLISEKPWNGDWIADESAKIAASLGANVNVGVWPDQATQLNFGLSLFQDFNWVIICDADERYERTAIEDLMRTCYGTFHNDILRTSNMDVYWSTPDYKIIPKQTDNPIIAVDPGITFEKDRQAYGGVTTTDIQMHHFSYVRSDEAMLKKIESFSHFNEFDTLAWYENVWFVWHEEMENLHPVVPAQFKKAVFDPCPDELRRFLP